ncbi:hypothetical protein KY284_000661 [Solanum tuberosum]|nr:hypothetical protein KY284_000661 [Solanum tuberosum]
MSLKFFKPLFDSFTWRLQELNVEQKGPKALPLIGNLHTLDPELHTYFASLSQTYMAPFVDSGLSAERASVGAEFRHVVTEMAELVSIPNLSDFYPGLAWFDFQGVVKKMKVLVKRFDKIFDNMIDQRQKLDRNGVGQESKDVLQVLLKLKDEADAKMPLTMIELKALLMDMVVGGTGSTANTVEFAIAEIMHKPDVLRKLQRELDIVVGKDNIVEESHIQQLPYLYVVMKEVLRIHPAIPLLAPHCPSETCTVGGYVVPKGSCVFINVWAI